jgi:hypothetical protein
MIEMIAEKDAFFSLEFKKEKGKVVAVLTNIDNGEIIKLYYKANKPATLIDFRMQCYALNDKGEE